MCVLSACLPVLSCLSCLPACLVMSGLSCLSCYVCLVCLPACLVMSVLSACLPVLSCLSCLLACLPVLSCPSCLLVCLPACLVSLSCLSVCLPACLCLSVCLPAFLSCLPACLSAFLFCLPAFLSCLLVCLRERERGRATHFSGFDSRACCVGVEFPQGMWWNITIYIVWSLRFTFARLSRLCAAFVLGYSLVYQVYWCYY